MFCNIVHRESVMKQYKKKKRRGRKNPYHKYEMYNSEIDEIMKIGMTLT